MNSLFNGLEGSDEKKWVGNRRKRFHSEIRGNVV